jgi:hypothetical protein
MRKHQSIFLYNVAKLIIYAYDVLKLELTGGELFRTQEQHELNVKQGKSRASRSLHQDRLAIDLNLFKDTNNDGVKDYVTDTASYKALGDYWVSLHPMNRWGGDWDKDGDFKDERFLDGNHFEMKIN